jgi:hypothetical protein
MTTDRLAFLKLAVVDDDLTLCDTRSALLNYLEEQSFSRNVGSLAYALVSRFPRLLFLSNRATSFRYNFDYLCSSRSVQSQTYTISG